MENGILDLIRDRGGENFELHSRYMNEQFVRALRTIGFDKTYVRAEGQYLFDKDGNRYLDLLSGFGVYMSGRNHPKIVAAIRDTLEAGLSNLVQMDCSLLSGLLAEALAKKTGLEKVVFCNSGAEAVEVAIKFARGATGKSRVLHCRSAYHGLTNGALSLNGDAYFKQRFGPLLPGCNEIPFNDPEALEACLRDGDVAAFIVEPLQGKSLNVPHDGYLDEVARLCRKYGALFIADEVQTGLGRTGKFLACEHWGVRPDIVTLSKGLSGGFVPIGAVLFRESIFCEVFNSAENAAVHMSTFAGNNLAMAAGLAALNVLEDERLIEKSARNGERLIELLRVRLMHHEFVREVRGKGMMIGIEFGEPKAFSRRATWHCLDKLNKGLFCQIITMPLLANHRILTQVAGHSSYVIKLIPPLMITDEDIAWTVDAFDRVLADAHKVGSPLLALFARHLRSA